MRGGGEFPVYQQSVIIGLTPALCVRAGTRCGARGFRTPVSLLVLRPGQVWARHATAFVDAARSFSRSTHPALLRVDDISERAGRPFVAAPPLTGGAMDRLASVARARGRAVSFDTAVRLVLDVAAGVQAHAALEPKSRFAGLCPETVWVTRERRALLLPTALHAGLVSNDGARFRAPELARGEGDSRTEVFSLALILWDLVTLHHRGAFDPAKLETSSVRDALSGPLRDLVLRSLSDDPADRHPNVQTFALDLGRVLLDSGDRTTVERHDDATIELGVEDLELLRSVVPRTLRMIQGAGAPRQLLLEGARARWVLGRETRSDLVVADPDVSRAHCEVLREADGSIRVADLRSKNGVFVNGKAVFTSVVRPGDELRLGSTHFRLEE
jgi:hypothetical protein